MSMQIREPETEEEFSQYYELRWKILCAPWNQPRGIERDPSDETSTHLMVVDGKHEVLGVGRLHFNGPGKAQIRYMAIDTGQQRMGVGTALLKALESRASELGALEIFLNARETALGFYLKHGYESSGPGHILFDSIAHIKMNKRL